MILRDTLLAVLRDQRPVAPVPPEVPRSVARRIPRASSQAVILTGVRRSGKSTLLSQLLRRKAGAAFINFEDTRLFGLGPEDFPSILSVLEELSRPGAAVGLDEVQEVAEWQRLVRSLLDRGRAVYLTGSNASLLGRELGAKLTGRHLSFEVLPFNFREYLRYAGRRADEAPLRAFLDDGGFPTYLRERNPELLRELVRDVIHRDVAARHGLREIRHLMNLALFLLANTGQPISLQRLTKTLSIPTVAQTSRYVEYLQDAYLLMAVPKFRPSFRKRVISPPKYYAVDTGLRRATSPQAAPDVGHRLENAVYLALRSRGGAVAYAGERDRWECDFVTDEFAIQVCAELTEYNRSRELAGLVQAARLPGKRRALVLTLNQSDRLAAQGLKVDVIPSWKWLTEAD
ncbi:MAG TPA: ATP-binding protein [Planctomycetota bacterium]|nr:ATP-binding protein [Planctomycetota bacterium]